MSYNNYNINILKEKKMVRCIIIINIINYVIINSYRPTEKET